MGGEAELGGLGQPLAAGDVRRGTILPGGYEVLDPIGSGGMGDVLLARALASGAKVAVKIIHGRSGERHLERFAREMRVARRIRHPNVVELLDHNQTADGVPFYVMEFLDGDDLATVLSREGALPWPRARAIMIQILHALAAAHERGVVHRDLKPSNCICVRSGAGELIKLVDFGIAKVSSDDPEEANLTRTGSVLGTPHYMSPEQAVGHEVDARADIYSAGVILFELLTGQVPFAGANPMGVLGRLITEAPPSPRHIAPEAEISPELEAIILRALAKRPEERFASATEFAEALRRVAGGPRRAAPTGIFRRPSRLYGRDEERAALLGAFNRAGAGERVCVLLSGDAGIGKSALVTDVLAHRAHLSAAKFDPESRDAPFVALLAVLRQLVGHALGQDDEARARLQRRLVSELGLGLPVVAQLLPELEALVGRQAPPAPASASASRNRLHAALLRLLAVDTHRVLLNLTRGAADRSIAVGLAALARAGIRVPDDPAERARECEVELAAIWAAIGERSIVEIADAPLCEDPETRAILRLLTELIAPAHMSAAGLADLLICKIVNLSLTRGSTDASAYGYVLFAFFLVTRRPQRAAHDFGRLALALNERLGDASQESRLHFVFGSILHLFAPLPEVLAHLERALVVGLEIGDHVFASYACSHALIALIGAGAPLDEVRERARAYLRVMGRTRVASSTAAVKIAGRVIACLLGECAGLTSLSGESFDEAAVIADLEAQNLGFPCLWYHVAKLALAYRAGDLDGARAAMVAGERRVFNLAWFVSTEFFFYKCMVLAELARSAPAEVDLAALRADADRLGECAALCPSSFTHKEAMVRAELAALDGDEVNAARLYDRAIAAARAANFPSMESLAAARAAGLQARRGLLEGAGLHAGVALAAAERWGARTIAEAIAGRFAALLEGSGWPRAEQEEGGAEPRRAETRESYGPRLQILARLLAEEDGSGRAIPRLLERVVKDTGADHGALLRDRGAGFEVIAAYDLNTASISRSTGRAIDPEEGAPLVPLRLSLRTGEVMVVDSVDENPRFASDPYIQRRRPRSLVCEPLRALGRTQGGLYLESRRSYAHFSAAALEYLAVVSVMLGLALAEGDAPADAPATEAPTEPPPPRTHPSLEELRTRVE